ncbi:MAG: pitrilysin family protein [Hyphomicrobiaceae bacterium]|nr:pitrilysin family protein [Hyphomicrobiaceae bacterium]
MSSMRGNGFRIWLDNQTPGRRLWMLIGGVCLVLGGLSLVLPQPVPVAAVVGPAVPSGSVVNPGLNGAAAMTSADTVEKPGAAGRPVKTITVARAAEVKEPPGSDSSVTSALVPGAAPTAIAASGPAAASEGRPSKAWRTAEAPAAKTPAATAASPAKAAETKATTASGGATVAPVAKLAKSKMKIQDITSPGGIKAWLVEEHSVPLLALRFVFDGGNSQDPAGKEGLANFITAMMDEGAGDLDATHFQERMEELAVRMSFEDSRDGLYGNFETLSANREPALEMLRLALNKPRFDADAVERIKKQLLANLAYASKNPEKVAAKAWAAAAFPGHAYGRPSEGTAETVASITSADLESFRRRTFARSNLKVVAVGDIDAKALAEVLDRVFGGLEAKAELVPVTKAEPKPVVKLNVLEMDVPQSVVQFGMAGLGRKDPDFMAAFVMNHILGGGGFASRLTEQVREKRGLAYSVYSYLQPYRNAALFAGGVATKNEAVKESIDVIRAELQRMADTGPTVAELENAKSYLTGSFALRFDTNSKIASQLLWMLDEEMGIDYVDKRNALVEAVTLEDVQRAAKRLLKVDDLLVTVVGKPKGLNPG